MKIFCFKAPKFLSFFLKPFAKKNLDKENAKTEKKG
jgi:hypothetical protein